MEVPLRGRVLQFSEQFIREAIQLLPELGSFVDVLELSPRCAFPGRTARRVGPMMAELIVASDVRRIELFMAIVGALAHAQGTALLISADYHPDPSSFVATGINEALAHISRSLTEPSNEKDLAAIRPGGHAERSYDVLGVGKRQPKSLLTLSFRLRPRAAAAGSRLATAGCRSRSWRYAG